MARLVYRRRPEPLPPASDIPALAAYWKAHFNTVAGKGTATKFIKRAGPYLSLTPVSRGRLFHVLTLTPSL